MRRLWVMRMKDSYSVVGAIYPRIGNITQEIDTQSVDSMEISFNPQSFVVTADVHQELLSSEPQDVNGNSSSSSPSKTRRSPRSPSSSSPSSPLKSHKRLSSWGSISHVSDEIVPIMNNTKALDRSLGLDFSRSESTPTNSTPTNAAAKQKVSKTAAQNSQCATSTSQKSSRNSRNSNGIETVNVSRGQDPALSPSRSSKSNQKSRSPKAPTIANGTIDHESSSSKDLNGPPSSSRVTTKKSTGSVSTSKDQIKSTDDELNNLYDKLLSLDSGHARRCKSGPVSTKDTLGVSIKSGPVKNIKGRHQPELSNLKVALTDCMKSPDVHSVENGAVYTNKSSTRRSLRQSKPAPKKADGVETVDKNKEEISLSANNDSPNHQTGSSLVQNKQLPAAKSGSNSSSPSGVDGSPPAKRKKNDPLVEENGSEESPNGKLSSKIVFLKNGKKSRDGPATPTNIDEPIEASTPRSDNQNSRNESYDLTPDSSSSPSLSDSKMSPGRSPVPRLVSPQIHRSLLSNASFVSATTASSSQANQRSPRRAATKSQQRWRAAGISPKSKAKPDNQAAEDAEIISLLRGLPAWQAWLQQKGTEDAQMLRAMCFLESPLPSNHVLHRVLLRSFGITEQDIFTWQPPNSLQLSQQHMLHIMKDIASHLQSGDINEIQRIMLKLEESDIQKYTKNIEFDEKYIYTDQETKQKIQSKMWNAVRDCLQEGCDKTGIIGGILNISDINVLVLLLNRTLDPYGDIYKSMLNSQLHKIGIFSFGKNNNDWLVNLRPRHTQEIYMEGEQTTIGRWLLAHVDSCCEITVQPVDELMRQNQLSVNAYLKEHLPKRLPARGRAKPTTMVILLGPVNLDIVNISAYCLNLIPYLLDCYSDVTHMFIVIDLGELEGTVIKSALIPDQLPDDVTHRVWMAADPKVLPVSCLVLQLTRQSRLPLTPCSDRL